MKGGSKNRGNRVGTFCLTALLCEFENFLNGWLCFIYQLLLQLTTGLTGMTFEVII